MIVREHLDIMAVLYVISVLQVGRGEMLHSDSQRTLRHHGTVIVREHLDIMAVLTYIFSSVAAESRRSKAHSPTDA